MQTHDAIRSRRAVKHYDPDHVMPQADLAQLFELAIQAPTAFNIQNWRFVVVTDPEQRQKIRAAAWDQAQVTDASVLIVVCADTRSWAKHPERYWTQAPSEVAAAMVPMIQNYYQGREQVQRDEAMRSCGMAAQTLMLAATAMGYQSCPMDGFDFDQVAEIIALPEDHVISMFVVIGKGSKAPWPKPGQLPVDEVLITDRFA
jgi:nitroreductase